VYLIGTAEQAHASLLEVSQAAGLIYRTCITGLVNRGGFALDIGGDNELAVVMQKNFPGNVQCLPRAGPPASTCYSIMNTIFSTFRTEIWGPVDNAQVQVGLPHVFSD
ncbi:MAG: hypothetical protein Q9226_009398, partial [Calogaya cf. arnoldii]